MRIEFIVLGVPKAKQRPRFVRTKWGGKAYTPKETISYENWVRLCWQKQSGKSIKPNTPISVYIRLYFPIPESYSGKKKRELVGTPHTKTPDADNCVKSILDGLQGCAFQNDSRIYRILVEKYYGEEARAEVALDDETGNGFSG